MKNEKILNKGALILREIDGEKYELHLNGFSKIITIKDGDIEQTLSAHQHMFVRQSIKDMGDKRLI